MKENSTIINSVIGFGTKYNGNIHAVDIIRVDGIFVGDIVSEDVILIGVQGKVQGILSSKKIIIAGFFSGTIHNTPLVIIQSSALVLGTINATNIITEAGSIISSSLKIKSQKLIQKREDAVDPKADGIPHVRIVEHFSTKMLGNLFND